MYSDNRIRILIMTSSLQVGGAELQLAQMIPRLGKTIFDVQVACYDFHTGLPRDVLEEAGVRVRFLGRPKWSKWRAFSDAVTFMKRERFDVVHAWHGSANRYTGIPALMAGVPVIIGGMRGPVNFSGFWRPILYSLMNWRASGWIVNSRKLKDLAGRKLWFVKHTPVFQVHNGLVMGGDERFRKDERTFFDGLKSDRYVVGIVGNLRPEKNHFLFLEAAKYLTESGLDADYWIIGDGPMKSRIERAIGRYNLKTRVRMLGYRRDVDVALSRMDIFVLTSDFESCPNTLLEAMRASLPVVATNCTTLEDIIEEDVNGHIVAVGDARGLAQKIKKVLAENKMRPAMGRNSYRIVEERFNMNSAVKKIENAYISCIRRESERNKRLKGKLEAFGL